MSPSCSDKEPGEVRYFEQDELKKLFKAQDYAKNKGAKNPKARALLRCSCQLAHALETKSVTLHAKI